MLSRVFREFQDVDGNFIDQFQSHGFSARVFELYLFAVFREQEFDIERPRPNPDFVLSTPWDRFAVEATTSQPSRSGALLNAQQQSREGYSNADLEYEMNELPIRLGGALYSKLNKRYWEAIPCRDRPFIIAIEPFHDQQALWASAHAVRRYLYGQEFVAPTFRNGRLEATRRDVSAHQVGSKVIPSGFFSLPEAQHVSAVLVTNQGTTSKFTRMGYLAGLGNRTVAIVREGTAFDPHPEAVDPATFRYWLDFPPIVETWSEGVVLIHNPNARHPLRTDAFKGAWQVWENGDRINEEIPPFAVYSSTTGIYSVPNSIGERGHPIRIARPLPMREANALTGSGGFTGGPWREDSWFANEPRTHLGALITDNTVWNYLIFYPDAEGDFVPVHEGPRFASRLEARTHLCSALLTVSERSAQRS